MPRVQNGVGRRFKKRRTSLASTIDVEQIEEEGVEELVVVEEETEEVAEIAIVESGEGVVMWVLVHVLEKVWADRDWQACQFVRYATLLSLAVREWKRQGRGTVGPFTGHSRKWVMRSHWRDERMSTLHAPHSISGHACNVPLAKVVSIGAGACESARAGLFRSGVGVAKAGAVLVC